MCKQEYSKYKYLHTAFYNISSKQEFLNASILHKTNDIYRIDKCIIQKERFLSSAYITPIYLFRTKKVGDDIALR